MEISLAAEPIFYLGKFTITNTLIVTILVSCFIISISIFLNKRLKLVPTGIQNIVEYIIESFLNLIDGVTQNRKQSIRFLPIVVTIFIFVIFSNWVEIIPGLGTVGVYQQHGGKNVLTPFIRSGSADLNMTLAIALISFFATQFMGITAIGIVKYAKKFFVSPFHRPYFIGTFVGALELISEIAKIISFSFRLFGNIFAGEVLLIVMLNLVPYIVPLPFLFLELFVGFVQALVFSMLTLVFMKVATLESSH